MNSINLIRFYRQIAVLIVMFMFYHEASCQEMPPRPISVYINPAQGLSFGAFIHGASGGSVIIYPSGSRSTTGSVVPMNMGYSYSAAIFEIDANPGTLVSLAYGSFSTLTGSNGGTMTLQAEGSYPQSPIVTNAVPPARTLVYIGGILTVGNALANPPGSYSGSFTVNFIQE